MVPPHSEVFLKGYIDRTSQGGVGIFEPNEKLLTKGLFVGRTLVDTTSGKSNIPVMNINDHQPCKIPCEAYIGTIQPVSRVSQLGVANPSVTLRAPQMLRKRVVNLNIFYRWSKTPARIFPLSIAEINGVDF